MFCRPEAILGDDVTKRSTTSDCSSPVLPKALGDEVCSKGRNTLQCAGGQGKGTTNSMCSSLMCLERGGGVGGRDEKLGRRPFKLCCFLSYQQSEHIEVGKGGSAILEAFGFCWFKVDLLIFYS